MNATANCRVCEETFDCSGRKPLVLPCGHTYCLDCLTDIETSGDKLCPACKKSWDCNAYKLPISYILTPNNNSGQKTKEEEEEKPDYDVCFTHTCALEYWCCKCQVATCKKCISDNHFAHGNIAFESLFETVGRIDNVKEKFSRQIAPKMHSDIKAFGEMCNEGLNVIELISESEKTLLSCKKHLLAQEKFINDHTEYFEHESSASVKGRVEILAKLMTRCDVHHSLLSQKVEVACTKLSTLNAGIKLMQEKFRETKQALLEEELNWQIEGEKNAQKILTVLATSDVQPPRSVTVMSTRSNPIHCLSELLIALVGMGCSIRLFLLDSFFYGVPFLNDFHRLEPAIAKDLGKNLASFYGYFGQSSNWMQLGETKLSELGLLLDSGAAVADLNLIASKNFGPTQAAHRSLSAVSPVKDFFVAGANQAAQVKKVDVVVAKAVVPVDVSAAIQVKSNVLLRLHIIELEDKEITWCSDVLPKLISPPRNNLCELWLHRCKLSKASLEKLVLVVRKTRAKRVRLHSQELSDVEQKQVQNYARQYDISVDSTLPNAVSPQFTALPTDDSSSLRKHLH